MLAIEEQLSHQQQRDEASDYPRTNTAATFYPIQPTETGTAFFPLPCKERNVQLSVTKISNLLKKVEIKTLPKIKHNFCCTST